MTLYINFIVLTLACPCPADRFVDDDQQEATIFWIIYLFLISSTCFGRCLRPSSGEFDCIYIFWYFPPILLLAGVMDEMERQFHFIFWIIYFFLISSTCFGRCLQPSSGALDCIYIFWYFPPILLLAGVMDEMERSSISSMTPASSNIGGKYQKM
jgi:hypothetical protein